MAEPLVLIDSNICIYLIEGLAEAARKRVERFAPGEVVTSAIAYAEVLRGVDVADPISAANAEAFFEVVPVLAFGAEAAMEYRQMGFKRHSFDRLIAAHALQLGLPLATNDESDFADVPGLPIENWVRP